MGYSISHVSNLVREIDSADEMAGLRFALQNEQFTSAEAVEMAKNEMLGNCERCYHFHRGTNILNREWYKNITEARLIFASFITEIGSILR